ncbi:arginine deiminase family protein, partial [Patulibacter sp. NPDC049589]|uniref:arginine deiminase family protein n=1 Tax=Patulibacter sp. NPDC049589 TaxID=3154731 RepID=UPI00343DB12A
MSSDARRPARRPAPGHGTPAASARRSGPDRPGPPAPDPQETGLLACGTEIAAILGGDDGGRMRRPREWRAAIATATRLGGDDVVVRQILVDLDVGADQLTDPLVLRSYVRELFDDVIWVRKAKVEHAAFVQVLQERGVEVFDA